MSPLIVPIEDARILLGKVSRQTIYDLINSNELESVKIGGRRFVTADSAKALVERNRKGI